MCIRDSCISVQFLVFFYLFLPIQEKVNIVLLTDLHMFYTNIKFYSFFRYGCIGIQIYKTLDNTMHYNKNNENKILLRVLVISMSDRKIRVGE